MNLEDQSNTKIGRYPSGFQAETLREAIAIIRSLLDLQLGKNIAR